MGLKQIMVDAGLVVEPLQVRFGDQLKEVLIPGVVRGQQGQVVGALIGAPCTAAMSKPLCGLRG